MAPRAAKAEKPDWIGAANLGRLASSFTTDAARLRGVAVEHGPSPDPLD